MYFIRQSCKIDLKTYEMLSLLSCAVASVPTDSESPLRVHTRSLLHKCLAQFSRQQQIHAQQAARYLCGLGDSISSHNTIPMMSGLLLHFLQSEYKLAIQEDININEDIEQPHLKIQ